MNPKAESRYALATFSIIVTIAGAAVLGFAYSKSASSQDSSANTSLNPEGEGQLGANDGAGVYFFGNNLTNHVGWQMPADALISTSFVTTKTVSRFLTMTIYVVPYELGRNTELHLGLYLNGTLKSENDVNVSDSSAPVDSMIGTPSASSTGQEVANFTQNSQAYQVGVLGLANGIQSGTTITMTLYSTSPIWIFTSRLAMSNSYELLSTIPHPTSLPSTLGATVVPSLSAQGEGE